LSEYSGHENLKEIAISENFNEWLYQEVSKPLFGNILEVGSGLGTFSKRIIDDFPKSKITLTDVSIEYVNQLKEKFSKENILVHKLDLNSKSDFEDIGYEQFDSIIAINVLEHVENDEFALQQLHKMLKKNGILVVLVPCHKFLFNVIDSHIGHFRRYTKKDLEKKIKESNFKIDKIFYFNMLGIIGWYINGNLCKNPQVNPKSLKFFDKMVPVLGMLEKALHKKIGLSLICYLKKSST